jgi:uncharacterized membrane protein YGL010W
MSSQTEPAYPPHAAASAAPAAAQRRIDALLQHYGESHTHPSNERIHFVAIPLIMLSLVGMLYGASPWVAYLFMAASLVYYVRLSVPFLLAMALITGAMLGVVVALDHAGILWRSCAVIFVVAWIFQFIGHKIEGRKPSFLEDIQYLWVGPLFVLSRLFLQLGLRW